MRIVFRGLVGLVCWGCGDLHSGRGLTGFWRVPDRSSWCGCAFHLRGEGANSEEDGAADEAEAAVDAAPIDGDAADGAGDEGEEEDADGADEAEGDDPFVADGVEVWADEEDGDDDVGEGEPVGAVGEERIAGVGVGEGMVDAEEPGVEGGRVAGEVEVREEADGEVELVLEREGGDAADEEAEDDDREPDADGAEWHGLMSIL